MIAEKCPDCGAGVLPNATECSYCGSVLVPTNRVVKWTAIKDHLPPVSPTDPNRSINVLTCFFGRSKDVNGSSVDIYPSSVKSTYYNFQKKRWQNDFYGERADPIFATHWMFTPAFDSPDWIPVVNRTPTVLGINGFSITVLACDKNIQYADSLIGAEYSLSSGHWVASLDLLSDDENALGHITASHWMSLPDRPAI